MHKSGTIVKILEAYNGDAIIVKTYSKENEEFIILIDGGTASTFDYSLKKELQHISKINLIILTHCDSDHIGGLIRFFKSSLIDNVDIDEIWINHPELIEVSAGNRISFRQADNLKKLILEKKPKCVIRSIDTNSCIVSPEGIGFTILSPRSEDLQTLSEQWPRIHDAGRAMATNISSKGNLIPLVPLKELAKEDFVSAKSIEVDIVNASSIACILHTIDGKILLLGDSRPETVERQLRDSNYTKENPLKVDFVKVSHHGSKNNTSASLLEIIDCNKYIISTNGGSIYHKHPSRETFAQIIYKYQRDFCEKLYIFTNYSLDKIKLKAGDFIVEDDFNDGNWEVIHQNIFNLNNVDA